MVVVEEEEAEAEVLVEIGSYGAPVRLVCDSSEEILLLWAIQQPTLSKHNAFVRQSSLRLNVDACGHRLSIFQSPSSMVRFSIFFFFILLVFELGNCAYCSFGTIYVLSLHSSSNGSIPGVTGAVMWDSGVVLAKFLEHAVDSGMLLLQGKKAVELGSGCGLVGCIAALLGAQVILTDLHDRLRLLKKNIETNLGDGDLRGSATVGELIWGEDPDVEFIEPLPDYVLGSDVIYSEGVVMDLLVTLRQLCGTQTTILLAGELRNDAILEYFLEAAMKEFIIGRVDQAQWHPDYCSSRVVMLVLVKKSEKMGCED
ncbi:hypothetical protein HHK36_030304 [Tetracentron sinense]|uniref:Uncharacterized protein n=1 Tax=Tetracentron sinense TaxID=13715 RepID=A0A835D1F4_TETSI|nr:hypothetical protein HHK36_030304 [Tetracentron sinense]